MKPTGTKCVITGHHAHELPFDLSPNSPETQSLQEKLRSKIIEFVEKDITYFYCGMELGVELWAGEILLALKDEYPDIYIHSVIASEHRADDWSDDDRERYFDELLPHCDEESYTSTRDDGGGAMLYRNSYLAKEGDIFIAVWNGAEICDTADLIRKAKKQRKETIVIEL